MAPLNVTELNELFDEGNDNPEIVNRWYEQLSKYDLDDRETTESIKSIMKAMKWIMHYEHTNAEELKELMVKEATEMGEKQEIWEEEKENLNIELKLLRERLAARTNATDLSETFRAQIDTLTEENVYLKARNEERDRELAEKTDKAEKLSSHIEELENERTKLIQQKIFLDDTVRELSKRLEIKHDESTTNDAEALKLRQRSQQAALLSKQLQEVAQQNDELRAEIDQLTKALTSATTFIEDTTQNYQILYEQLMESEKIIERLTNDNELLSKKFENEKITIGKLENIDNNTIQYYKELLQNKDEEIEALQLKSETLQIELQELQAQNRLVSNTEDEKELERLRMELLDATKIARQFFDVTIKNNKIDMSVIQMQCKITALNETINKLNAGIKQHEIEKNDLVRNLEMKDAENQHVNAELKRLRTEIFGNAELEISRLEKQINFREQQIEKLTAKCSLLQIELCTSTDNQILSNSISATTKSMEQSLIQKQDEENDEDERDSHFKEISSQPTKSHLSSDFIDETPVDISKIKKKPMARKKNKQEHLGSLESFEASALIISSLNHELMLLMQELDDKDRQLQCMEKSVQNAACNIDELKVNYYNLQKELSMKEITEHNKTIDELRQQMECYEIKIEEYQKLANTIRLNGNELEQKMEEMNRQIIAERLRNLQLFQKLEIVENNRSNQNVEYRKLEKSYQDQRLLHVKQLKIANYESDLASIEIARLQTLLLHSVPKRDYDKLLAEHKRVLISDDNYYKPIDDLKNDDKDNDYMIVNLLEMSDETKSAEIAMENVHLKEMINVLRSQNEYWQNEVAKIREQNTEMMHFLDDVESESQMKNLLVALERRFLKALSDRAQFLQNQKLTDQQLFDQQNEFAKKKRNWANEKKKLIQMIRSLQLLFQRMKSNSMEFITVQQMLHYKEKFIEINANYAKSQQYKGEIEREKDELELQLRHAEALRKSYELLHENDYNVIKLRKNLQASHFNLLNEKKQLGNAQLQIQKKDEQIQKLEERINSQQREIEDLFAATYQLSNFDDENETFNEFNNPPSTTDELFRSIEKDDKKVKLNQNIIDKKEQLIMDDELLNVEKKDETPTDTVDSESDIKHHTGTDDDDTYNIAHNHSEEYVKKLNYICETAKLCIANYKEQLKYKDEVIEKYKSLLNVTSNESNMQEIIVDSDEILNDSTKGKLRTSSEILLQNYNTNIEAKDMEIVKLRNEIEQFIKANRRLTKNLQNFRNQTKDNVHCSTQTEFFTINDNDDNNIDKNVDGIISNDNDNLINTIEESRKNIISQEQSAVSRITTLSSISSSSSLKKMIHTEPSEVTDQQNDNNLLMETLRKDESKMMIMRMEIRNLKQRNAALQIQNQELEKACENIRIQALSEIKESYTSNINFESEAIVMRLRQELSDLKIEAGKQKKLIREQKEIIDRFQKNQSLKNEEITKKWHEKKAYESNINLLRKKLKETEQREHEACEKLKKFDQQIKQLYKSENNRSIELKRLQEMVKKLKNDKEINDMQVKLFNDQLKTAEETNIYLNQKIIQIRKENSTLLLNVGKMEKSPDHVKTTSDTVEMEKIMKRQIDDEELCKLKEKSKQVDDLLRQIIKLEAEIKKQHDEIRTLNDKLNERKYDCGAVAVLRDKLMAKEKLIEQQQQRIEELEREKWQNLL